MRRPDPRRLPSRPRHLLGRRSRVRALSAYWDQVVRRAPADPVPPADVDRASAAMVRHLHASPLHPAPRPSFADQLLDTVLQPRQGDRPMPATPSFPAGFPLDPAVGGLPRPRGLAVDHRPRVGRWSGVALAGLIAAVVLAALWTASLRGDDPPGRRDTTALAAVGTPAANIPPLGAATPVPANQTVGNGNTLFYTAAVDLVGNFDIASLWLLDVEPGRFLWAYNADPRLVMPLSGTLRDQGTGATISGGQSSLLAGRDEWRLENTGDATVQVLVLTTETGGDGTIPTTSVGPQHQAFAAVNLGPIALDPTFDAALLEVRRSVGGGSVTTIDTGRDGVAIVLAEQSPTIVDLYGGDGALRRLGSDDGSGTPVADPPLNRPDQASAPVYLATGDVLTVTGGAALTIRGRSEGTLPVLVVTLRFDSALLPSIQSGGVLVTARTNAAGTPVAPDACGVGRYTADELRSLLATPAAAPLPALGFGLADGVPADPWTARDIEGAADRLAACVRTNDPLRYARLWTADGIRLVYSVESLEEALASAPMTERETGFVDATVQDVRVHGDGRVSAVVDLDGEVAYVVWVKVDGVYLVELFNDTVFAGEVADGARCDAVPLAADELDAIVPATLTPASFPPGDGGLDISEPAPEGSTPAPVAPDAPGAQTATEVVGHVFDCLSTLDPARVAALATDGFRAEWLGVATGLAPLAEPMGGPVTRFPLAVPTVFKVEAWENGGVSYLGVGINGATLAYLVLEQVDGEWMIDGWAPL